MKNSRKKIVWSYSFFYYTWLKNFRKEENGMSEIPHFAALIPIAFLLFLIFSMVSLFLVGSCRPDFLDIKLFPKRFDWINQVLPFVFFFIFNAWYFLGADRYKNLEKEFDCLSLETQILGHRISWGVVYFIVAIFMGTLYWYSKSDYNQSRCSPAFYEQRSAKSKVQIP